MSSELVEQLLMRPEWRRALDPGAYLFHRGDPVGFVFVVTEGTVELVRSQPDGKPIVLQRADRHAVLAEASLYSDTYHCDAIAAVPSDVIALSRATLLARLRDDSHFARLWLSHLAAEVQIARYRSEILSRNTVAERLNAWLTWRGIDLPPKGEWKGVAIQIGISPEALYRELSKRRSQEKNQSTDRQYDC